MVLGALVLWRIAIASVSASMPEIYSPYPQVVLIFVLSLIEVFSTNDLFLAFGPLAVPLLFVFWSFPLVRGQERIPRRTLIAAGLVVGLSVAFFGWGFAFAPESSGSRHMIAMYLFNVIFLVLLLVSAWRNLKVPSYKTNFAFHWFLFAWLGWAAFPWVLGDTL